MKKSIKRVILSALMLSALSCVDEQDLFLSNPNAQTPSNFSLSDEASLLQFSTAAYGDLQLRGTYARHAFFIHDGMSDECDAVQMEADKQQMHDYTLDAANIGVMRYWVACYQGINKANNVISNSQIILDSPVSEIAKNQAIGENHFLRALYYFMLTTRFGGVPMPLAPATSNDGLPRTAQPQVYNQILADLEQAILLCETKVALGSDNYGRATKGAAHALKGKVHLYLGQYDLAVTSFRNVISDPSNYTLSGVSFGDNFDEANEHNAESIFEINFNSAFPAGAEGAAWTVNGSGNAETTFRAIEYGNFGNLPASTTLEDAFEDDDPRLPLTIIEDEAQGNKWRKYTYPNLADNIAEGGINVRVIRMADVLLMLAESLNAIDFTANIDEVLSLMNTVRDRVGMPNYGTPAMNALFPVDSQDNVLAAIQHERRVELAGEQVRLNDLLRWGIAKEKIEENRMNTTKGAIPINFEIGKHELLPIPTLEIDNNNALTNADQNPGY